MLKIRKSKRPTPTVQDLINNHNKTTRGEAIASPLPLDILIQSLCTTYNTYDRLNKAEDGTDDQGYTLDAQIKSLRGAILSHPAQTVEQAAAQLAISLNNPNWLERELAEYLHGTKKEIDKRRVLEEINELNRAIHSAVYVLEDKLPPEIFRSCLTHIENGERQDSPFPKAA